MIIKLPLADKAGILLPISHVKITWLPAMFARNITQDLVQASTTAWGLIAEHVLEYSSVHFIPVIF